MIQHNFKIIIMKKITQFLLMILFLNISFSVFSQHTVTSFSPTSGVVGTTVYITGTNFSTEITDYEVRFNNVIATISSVSTTMITVEVPNTVSTGEVSVKIGSNTQTATSLFTVLPSSDCNGLSNNNSKHWYFGNHAAIKFENNIPTALTNSAMNQVEGVATMSDFNGNLLFYTNGITVYNKNHQIMENGSGLLSHNSNTQAAFIVPFPGNPNQYFIVTPDPYRYSIVDMTLDNGNGAILTTAKNILLTTEASEKVAGVLASNQRDIWLITYSTANMRFNVYRISSTGINTTPVVSNFAISGGYYGYMKISPDGTKIVTANFNSTFHLYDFDASTGIVSNQKVITSSLLSGHGSYGIEFSPNNNLIYVADHRGANKVYQFDITLSTPQLIAGSALALAANTQALGALQLGPDNRIYVAKEGGQHLGVIENPNTIGTGCNYVSDGVHLAGKASNLGLPGFVSSSIVKAELYIISFNPNNGFAGEIVTITGINFNTIIGNNVVKINGVEAEVTAASENNLTIIIPENATTGKITVEVGCGLVSSTDDFTVNELSVTEFSKNKVVVYPNPLQSVFTISTEIPLDKATIIVADTNGRVVLENNFDQLSETSLNLSSLQAGMYLLKIISENQNYQHKLIKR